MKFQHGKTHLHTNNPAKLRKVARKGQITTVCSKKKITTVSRVLSRKALLYCDYTTSCKSDFFKITLACVASVSVEQRAKDGVFGVLPHPSFLCLLSTHSSLLFAPRKRLLLRSPLPPPPSNVCSPPILLCSLLHGKACYAG